MSLKCLEFYFLDSRTYYFCYRLVLGFKMLKVFRVVSVIFVLFIICLSGLVMGSVFGTLVKIKFVID